MQITLKQVKPGFTTYQPQPNNSRALSQACLFTDFAAIQDNGISLILSLEKKSLSLGGKSLSFRKNT